MMDNLQKNKMGLKIVFYQLLTCVLSHSHHKIANYFFQSGVLHFTDSYFCSENITVYLNLLLRLYMRMALLSV